MNSFRVVLSLTVIFIIAIVADTNTGYMFFYRNINVLLLIAGAGFVLFVLAAVAFRKLKKETLL